MISQTTLAIKRQRDLLLQESLRETNAGYGICEEYPTVLSESNFDKSLCLLDSSHKKIIAHANFYPEKATSLQGSSISIGLIGNVATSPQHRRQGHMSVLFNYIKEKAIKQNIEALILWSDLIEYYQKLGFKPVGKERRFSIHNDTFSSTFQRNTNSNHVIRFINPYEVTPHVEKHMLSLRSRPKLTLERSVHKLQKLLAIPDTVLLAAFSKKRHTMDAFAIIGKGQDMVGVIHEWGFCHRQAFIELLSHIFQTTEWPTLLLLSHMNLEKFQYRFIKDIIGAEEEIYPMALGMLLNIKKSHLLNSLYIFGLDAI